MVEGGGGTGREEEKGRFFISQEKAQQHKKGKK